MLNRDLDIGSLIGRQPAPMEFETVRELEREDIPRLSEPRDVVRRTISRLTERHHSLARILASGADQNTAAITCGYVPSSLSILMDDPTFKELVVFYRENVTDAYMEVAAQLAGLSVDAIAEMRTRLEDSPEKIGTAMLNDIIKMAADRTGHGPSTTSTQVNVHVDLADRMKAARERASSARMIDITPNSEE